MSSAKTHRGADAVLVAHELADRVAERLLEAEDEAPALLLLQVHRAIRDPLEAGEHLFVVRAERRRPSRRASATTRSTRSRAGPAPAPCSDAQPAGEQVVTEQRAHLITCKLHVSRRATRAGQRDGEAVGVGIVRDHEIGLLRAGERERRGPSRPSLRGSGTRRWGSGRRASAARAPTSTFGKPASANARRASASPTPCIGV